MKNVFLLLPFCFLFAISSSAQTGMVRYDNASVYPSGFSKIIPTSDGGYISNGVSGLTGWITKFDGNMNVLWSMSTDSIPMRDVVETNDGNYVFLGISYRTDYPNNPLYILKTSPSGTIIFQKRYYDPTFANALTADGICKAAGNDQGFLFYGGNCIAAQYAIKCDVNGNIQWEKNNIGMGNGYIATLIPDGAGYVGCFSFMNGNTAQPGIIRFDTAGNILAVKTFITSSSIQMYHSSLVQLNGGFAIVCSRTDNYGAMIITVDAAFGNVTCNRIGSGLQISLSGNFGTLNANDEIVVTGSFDIGYPAAIVVNPYTGIVSARKIYASSTGEFDNGIQLPNGNILLYGVLANDAMAAMTHTSLVDLCNPQDILISTQSNYPYTPGTPTITQLAINAAVASVSYSYTNQPLNTITVCGNLSSTEETAISPEGISIHPNPSDGIFHLVSEAGIITEISAFDIRGREVFQTKPNSNTCSIDFSDLPAGVYFITVNSGNDSFVRKLIRQ